VNDSPYVELSQRLDYRHSLGQMAPFFAALSDSRIAGTRCVSCQRTYVPPRATCPIDASPAVWADVATSGTVVATSTIARRPKYAADGPPELVLGLVQLDGVDTALLAELVDDQTIEAGARVEAVFRDARTHPVQQLAFAVRSLPTAKGDQL
jgi:uncharacterized OB-fold protein